MKNIVLFFHGGINNEDASTLTEDLSEILSRYDGNTVNSIELSVTSVEDAIISAKNKYDVSMLITLEASDAILSQCDSIHRGGVLFYSEKNKDFSDLFNTEYMTHLSADTIFTNNSVDASPYIVYDTAWFNNPEYHRLIAGMIGDAITSFYHLTKSMDILVKPTMYSVVNATTNRVILKTPDRSLASLECGKYDFAYVIDKDGNKLNVTHHHMPLPSANAAVRSTHSSGVRVPSRIGSANINRI